MATSSSPRQLFQTIFGLAALALTTASLASAQPTFSKVFTPSTIGPGSVSTITFTITNGSGSVVTDLAFTDTLPAAVTIADPANVQTDCDLASGGSLTAPDGGSTITLSGSQIGAFLSCTIMVDVTSTTPGMHTNPAITLSSNAGSSMSLPVDLTVDTSAPGFLKSFAPSSVPLGDRSTLTLTFDNSASATAVTFLSFTDTFPPGMVIADPANTFSDCGMFSFSLAADPGTDFISLLAQGAAAPGFEVVPAGGTCTIALEVTTTGAGMLDNVTGDLTYRTGFDPTLYSAGKASDTLEVTVTPLAIRKEFTDDPTPPGNTATLEFVLDNRDRTDSATNLAFTDDLTTVLPGLTFASLLSNDCGGSVGGLGGTTISLSGGSLPTEGSCTILVSLAVPLGATPGAYTNSTSTVTADVGGSPTVGNVASDILYVEPIPLLTKTFLDNPIEPGDPVTVEFTVTNTSTTSSATNLSFSDPFPEILPTASVTPGNGCCGGGSTCSFTPLINPPPPSSVIPATLTISGGTLDPAGMPNDSCTFTITLDSLPSSAPGVYPNVTSDVTATVDGATRTGPPATDDLTVVAAPDLSKTFTDDPVAPGGMVTLEFTLTHSPDAATDATGITFTDNLAPVLAGLTANFPPTPDPPCGLGSTFTGSAGDTLLTLANGTLAPGDSCTWSVTLDVPAGAVAGDYTNTTSGVAATVDGLAVTSGPVSDDLTVSGLTFAKEFVGDPVLPGDTVSLRFTIENVSPNATDDASSLDFSDPLANVLPGTPDLVPILPATVDTCGGTLIIVGVATLDYSGGSLPIGSTCTIELDVMVPAGAPDGQFINTTSLMTAIVDGSLVIIDAVTDDLIINSNLLQLSKAFTDDPVAPGDPVTLEFNLVNLDAAQAASDVAFTDDLGAALTGLIFDSILFNDCGGTVMGTGTDMIDVSGVALPASGSCTLRVSLTVPGGATAGIYPNTTSGVTGMIGGFAVVGDPGSDDLEVLQLLMFSKSFDGPTTATGMATLTFTILNPGTDTATGISFTDDLNAVIPGLIATSLPPAPCGLGSSITGISFLTVSGGSLPPSGGMCSFDVDVLVPVTATAGTHPNTTSDLFESGLMVAEPATADLVIEPPPTFAKVFAPDFIGFGQTSTLTFTVDNSASALAASSVAFTDNLPAGIVVATPAVTSNTCGGTLTATAASGVIMLTGGSVGAGASCTIAVDVVGNANGAFVNTTGDLTSSSGNSGTASDTLTVNPQPGFAKVFAPDPILIGGTSTLTFTIDNTGSTVAASLLAFTDNLPAAIVNATPANAVNNCGGALTAADGGTSITLSGGTVAAGATCTISVDVTSGTAGTHTNTSGSLTSSLGTSGTAADTLTVNPPPTFAKVFAPDVIASGAVSTLTFTIDNTASTVAASSLDFTDNLPAAISVATPAGVVNSCAGGAVTATSGTSVVSYTSGTVAAGASCTLSVDVTSTTAGDHVNLTGDLTSSSGNSGTATDSLRVNPQPGFTKVFAPNPIAAGDVSTVTFTIDNTGSTVDATALDFTDNLPAGITVATPANVVNTCTGGTVTATAGTAVISYTGGTVSAGASCTLSVDVTGAAAGDYVNTTGDLTSSLGNSGPASDTLRINPQPGFAKAFAPDPIAAGEVATLTFTIDNTGSTVDATGLDFTDNLPFAITVATPAGVAVTCTGGTVTANPGTSVVSYTGGTALAGASCTLAVDVTSVTPGTHVNLTGDLTSSLGNSGTATDDLTVNPQPSFTKVFAPNPIPPGGVSTLTFTIDNTGSTVDATGLDFTDVMPAAITVATPANVVDTCTGGTATAVSGTATITYTGGTVATAASCTISVDVTSATVGNHVNVTGDLTSSLGNSGTATDTLEVVAGDLVMTKSFIVNPVLQGGSVVLEYVISNVSLFDATAIAFTDDLDAVISGLAAVGLRVPQTAELVPEIPDVCGTGSNFVGTSVLSLTGGNLLAGTSCTFSATLVVPPNAPLGVFPSTSSDVTGLLAGAPVTGAAAAADLETVFLEFSKTFLGSASAGGTTELEFTITNPDPTNAATDINFTDDLEAVLPGLEAVGLPASNVCGAGSQISGTSLLTLTGGNLAGGESCTFAVTVQIPSTTPNGIFINVTSELGATVGGLPVTGDPAAVAEADIEVTNAVEIPALGQWGLLLLAFLLAAVGAGRARRSHGVSK